MMEVMRGAESFYLKGDDIGCLLVHGFTGTPHEMRWLGEQLAQDGRSVLGVRLAGHGTNPEDLNETRWRDWYESVVAGYRQLRAECAHVFVIGLSLGGALALHLAAHEQLDGVVAMATPLRVRSWRLTVFRPFQRWIPYWQKGKSDMLDEAMRAAHLEYDRMPTICLLSLLELLKTVEGELPRIDVPTLLIFSQRDQTAPPREMRYLHERLAAHDKRMVLLERSGHIVCEDVERETVLREIRAFIQSHQTNGQNMTEPLTAISAPA